MNVSYLLEKPPKMNIKIMSQKYGEITTHKYFYSPSKTQAKCPLGISNRA